jgi:hypothetical protein
MILSPLPSCREDDLAFAFLSWSYLARCGAIRWRMAQDAETRTTIDELLSGKMRLAPANLLPCSLV